MNYPIVNFPVEKALALEQFREMDYYAVNQCNLPVELMMENAGLQLANLVAASAKKSDTIQIGVGNGNNGGGGLVAARRLAGWGYKIHLSLFTEINRELPKRQLERAILFGAVPESIPNPDVWVDAWLGFSQRLPLKWNLLKTIDTANNSPALKISLDIPTGYLGDLNTVFFKADKVLTLAAPKKILYHLDAGTELYVADLGIPEAVYKLFNTGMLPFNKSNIIRLKR